MIRNWKKPKLHTIAINSPSQNKQGALVVYAYLIKLLLLSM